MPGDREPIKCFKTKDIAVKDAKNWVVRGRERPRPAGLPRRLAPPLVAPAHVLPETNASTGPVLTEYQTRPQERPKGEQP